MRSYCFTYQGRKFIIEMSCAQCHTTGFNLRKCSRCRLVYYCSKDCQAKNWPIHKSYCKYQEQNKTDDTEGKVNQYLYWFNQLTSIYMM